MLCHQSATFHHDPAPCPGSKPPRNVGDSHVMVLDQHDASNPQLAAITAASNKRKALIAARAWWRAIRIVLHWLVSRLNGITTLNTTLTKLAKIYLKWRPHLATSSCLTCQLFGDQYQSA